MYKDNLEKIPGVKSLSSKKGGKIILDSCPYVDSIAFSIFIRVGSIDENKENMGISHFVEHLILRNNGNDEITSVMDDLGGFINASTTKEYTCFYGKTTKENFEESFQLLFNHVFYPHFTEDHVHLERRIILEELNKYKDMPQEQIKIKSIQNIFPFTSISNDILGEEETLNKLTLKDLSEYHQLHYTPENTVISISGNLQEVKEEYLLNIVDSLEKEPADIERDHKDIRFNSGMYRINATNISQSYIAITYPTYSRKIESKKAVGLILLNALLTGMKSSLLQKNLREEMGMIYSIYSYPSFYETFGLFQIFTSTSKVNEKKVLGSIQEEFKKLLLTGFDGKTIQRAKNRLKSEYSFQLERLEDRMNFFGKNTLLHEKFYDNFLEQIDLITQNDINDICKGLLSKDPSITVIGD